MTFLMEHTLPRWVEALGAALTRAQSLPGIEQSRLLVVGHSEGGVVAARLAAERCDVSHVALLSSSGPTQLFDLAEEALAPLHPGEGPEAREERVQQVFETFERIRADPDSVSKFAWGHPYRRWSSFLATSTLDELLRSRARIFLVHGSQDRIVPVAAHDVLRGELVRHGRSVVARRIEGADHGYRMANGPGTEAMESVMQSIIEWFGK
jgi:pimeloyl-ACP methyl ester carboxylesterase